MEEQRVPAALRNLAHALESWQEDIARALDGPQRSRSFSEKERSGRHDQGRASCEAWGGWEVSCSYFWWRADGGLLVAIARCGAKRPESWRRQWRYLRSYQLSETKEIRTLVHFPLATWKNLLVVALVQWIFFLCLRLCMCEASHLFLLCIDELWFSFFAFLETDINPCHVPFYTFHFCWMLERWSVCRGGATGMNATGSVTTEEGSSVSAALQEASLRVVTPRSRVGGDEGWQRGWPEVEEGGKKKVSLAPIGELEFLEWGFFGILQIVITIHHRRLVGVAV